MTPTDVLFARIREWAKAHPSVRLERDAESITVLNGRRWVMRIHPSADDTSEKSLRALVEMLEGEIGPERVWS